MLIKDDRPIIPGITVKAATVDALVDLLIVSIPLTGDLMTENSNFPRVMLLMHQWFTTSENLALCLVSRFWDTKISLSKCRTLCLHTDAALADCAVHKYRERICQMFRYWFLTFPTQFNLNIALTIIVKDFHYNLKGQSFGTLADHLDFSKLSSFYRPRSMPVVKTPSKHTRETSFVYDYRDSSELAEHITYLEFKVMQRIIFSDFKAYVERDTRNAFSTLDRSISLSNGISHWIQLMVLKKSLPQQRADVIEKFVFVAESLLQMNNFNSLMSVVGGLTHTVLARLTNTMARVPSKIKKKLENLDELLASASNYKNYRNAFSQAKGFKIPILGVHMKDLIALHVAFPETVESGLINFRKMAHLSFILQELYDLQNSVPKVAVNDDLVNTLRCSLEIPYSEDYLYDLSLKREPRKSLSVTEIISLWNYTKKIFLENPRLVLQVPIFVFEEMVLIFNGLLKILLMNYKRDKN